MLKEYIHLTEQRYDIRETDQKSGHAVANRIVSATFLRTFIRLHTSNRSNIRIS